MGYLCLSFSHGVEVPGPGLLDSLGECRGRCWSWVKPSRGTLEEHPASQHTKSERTTRVIDFDQEASMEQKKREGYF